MFPLAGLRESRFLPRMPLPRLLLALLLSAGIGFAAENRSRPSRPAAAGTDTTTLYKGAIAIDAASGKVLFEERADIVSPPASMTKLMTYAIVHDAVRQGTLRLDTPVRITKEDARMGGTQVYLDPRETFTVDELLYAVMVQSANDAAHALARAAAGSVPAFVAAMNAKARELGMSNTTFRTPHGLPPPNRVLQDGDLTSPRDFARLSRHLLTTTDITTYTSVRLRTFGEGKRAKPMEMKNHNNLVSKVAGVDGLKTGYTAGAGFCLSATAQRNGRRVIVVMMGSPQAQVRDLHVSELIERAFAAVPAPPPVIGGTAPATPATPAATAATSGARPTSPASSAPAKPQDLEPVVKFSLPKR